MAVNKVVKSDGSTIIDITPTTATASDVATGKVFFGADGTEQTGTASNDFVITLTENSSVYPIIYEPDCTFAEAQAAYSGGKTLVFVTNDGMPCTFMYDEDNDAFMYAVVLQYSASNWRAVGYEMHMWTSTGVVVVNNPEESGNLAYLTDNATATPADVASGKVFYNADGRQIGTAATGGGSAITVIDETDEHGGTIRTITAVDLTGDTVSPSTLLKGYTAHDSKGNPITGTATGGSSTLIEKTITANGTYNASSDNADGYSKVTVNVPVPEPSLQIKTKTYTPTESQQTATIGPDSGYDGLGKVNITIDAISSTYVGTKVTRQAAKTVTPTKSAQTAVASGVYTTGAITVAAIPDQYITTTDATATAAQINSGATAYVNGVKVTGTQVIQTYYTGTSDPSASTGSDGDIYLKVVS